MAEKASIFRAIEAQRKAINRGEMQLLRKMTKLWVSPYRFLLQQIDALTAIIRAEQESGRPVTMEYLYSLDRYRRMRDESLKVIRKYNRAAEGLITGAEADAVELGRSNMLDLISIARVDSPQWTRVNKRETRIMSGMLSELSPLRKLLDKACDIFREKADEILLTGLALGQGSQWIADRLSEAARIPLQRAQTIARTEVNRAYRQANLETMRESRAVIGYRRMCYPPTACFACLMMDGEFYEKESDFSDHPNGKCSAVPVTKHFDPINDKSWKRGQDWFMKQDPETQRKLMGKGRYDLWQSGQVDLRDMVYIKENPLWGGSPAMLRIDLLGVYDFVGTTAANGTKISSFSNHSLNRLEERNVSLYGIEEALTNPIIIEDRTRPGSPAIQLIGNHAYIRINPITGTVITVMKRGKK